MKTLLIHPLLAFSFVVRSSAVFTQYWNVTPPLNYNDTLYAGWSQLPIRTEIEVYNGVAEKRTYAHHPELYSRPDTDDVYLIHSSALIDEDSMGQQIWFAHSGDGGFTWSPSSPVLLSALLPNQTSERNFSYWCDAGIQQRAFGGLAIIDFDNLLYAIGETTNWWCAGSLGSGTHGAGRVARPMNYDGTIAGDPCWIQKNNWTDAVGYNATIYGTKYGMKDCLHAADVRAILEQPEHVPAWSAYLYNNDLYASDDVHYMQENTNAVWIESAGTWQRFWRDITATNNTMSVWVEYSTTGTDWYPVELHAYGNAIYQTDIPDAKTKQFLYRVNDDLRVFISNPRNNSELVRDPLTLATSRGDASIVLPYNSIGVLRTNASTDIAPDTRDYKNLGFQYPTATKVGDNLVVAYSENKQNIWVSVMSLEDLP